MLTEILVAICLLVFLRLFYNYAIARPPGFPPGPPRVPIFGSYLFMMMANFKYLHKGILKFSKWYKTDIIGFYMGTFSVVQVNSPTAVKEVLNNGDFDGRPVIFLAEMRDPDLELTGIFFKEGALWKEQRRFILRYLRDFGFGRRFEDLELVIQEEITDMLDLIRNGPRYEHEKELVQPGGSRVLLPFIFNTFLANCIFYVIYNERKPRAEQAELLKLVKLVMQFQRAADGYGKMLSVIPWVGKMFPKWSSYDKLVESNQFIFKYFSNFIDHHIATYDESCERNFLDLYIKEIKQSATDEDSEETSTFSRKQLIMSLIDFSFPALSAISAQISLLIQYLMLHPKVLKRVQDEIDEVVGSGRLPTLEDRKYLHYTEATVREGLRIETLVPSNVGHKALVDTELMGYQIPKGTIIFTSLYALHLDKSVWGDPENFRPERFLDENGQLSLKKDISLPFGAGKRLCAGETFARNMLFLITCALCQNFDFVLGPGDKLPDLSTNLSGLIISPKDFWVQLRERKCI